jgi:hypothetical protein
MLFRMVHNLKHINCLLLNFLFNIFDHDRLQVSENLESRTEDKEEILHI